MLKIFSLLLLSLLVVCVVAVPQYPTRSSSMIDESDHDEIVNQQLNLNDYLNQQQLFDSQSLYASQQARSVQCPVGTRALSVPMKHVKFWKSLGFTQRLTWSNSNRFLCVPNRMISKLSPIIQRLKSEKMMNIDPTTNPMLMREISKIDVEEVDVAPVDSNSIEQENQINQLMANGMDMMDQDDFQINGPGKFGFGFGRGFGFGFGRGFGGWGRFGGLGYGFPYGGFGFPYGVGFGLGYPYGGGFGFPYAGFGYGLW